LDIDTSIKEFVKNKDEIKHIVGWFLLDRNNRWLNKKIMRETNWKWSKQIWMESKITTTKTNTTENNIRKFAIKLLNEELPTMSNLNTRKPDLYREKLCPFCNKYNETNLHVFICENSGKEIEKLFIVSMGETYRKIVGQTGWGKLKNKLIHSNLLKKDLGRQSRDTINTDRFSLFELIRGLILQTLYKMVRQVVRSTIEAKEIIIGTFNNWKLSKWECWKERCERFLKWEEINNIDKKQKRQIGTGTIINYNYIDRKKILFEKEKKLVNTILTDKYINNSDIISNILFNMD